MKKNLIAFYVKLGLAVGIPVLGVAAAIAISNNNAEVEYREVDILEADDKDSVDLQGDLRNSQESGMKDSNVNSNSLESASGETTVAFLEETRSQTENKTNSDGNSGNNAENGKETESEPDDNQDKETDNDSETEPETPTKPKEPIKPETPTEPTSPELPTDSEKAENLRNAQYTYDALGRVIRVEYDTYIIEYEYDKNGNILSVKTIEK